MPEDDGSRNPFRLDPAKLQDELDEALEEYDDEGDVDPAFYRHGGVSLSDSEREALGDLQGKRLLMVQAGNGEDVLSLKNLGAVVTCVDDEESLEGARALAEAAGAAIEFVEDDPSSLSDELRRGQFDVAYSGFSSLVWLPSLDDWASGIAAALKRGGRLVIYDEHPIARMFGQMNGHLFVSNSYFGETVEWEDDEAEDDEESSEDQEAATEHDLALLEEDFPGGPILPGPEWTLGDVIDALGANGLAVVSFKEFPESDRYETSLDTLVDVEYDEVSRVPGAMLIIAVKL